MTAPLRRAAALPVATLADLESRVLQLEEAFGLYDGLFAAGTAVLPPIPAAGANQVVITPKPVLVDTNYTFVAVLGGPGVPGLATSLRIATQSPIDDFTWQVTVINDGASSSIAVYVVGLFIHN